MAVRDEPFPNFLTKLGIITRMIDDVTQFRIRLKRSRSRFSDQPPKRMDENIGLNVEATEAILKMKKKSSKLASVMELSKFKKPISFHKSKANKLTKLRYASSRRNHDKDKLVIFPLCVFLDRKPFFHTFHTSFEIIER